MADETAPYFELAKQGLVYTSPSGVEFRPYFQDTSEEQKRKAKVFSFIDRPGSYVQDLDMKGVMAPVKVYFAGDQHVELADAFQGALSERGVGRLVLPLDKSRTRNVVPLGYKRVNKLVNEANRTVFTVDFAETTSEFNESIDVKTVESLFPLAAEVGEAAGESFAEKASLLDKISGAPQKVAAKLGALKDSMQKRLGFNDQASVIGRAREALKAGQEVLNATRGAVQELNASWESVITSIDSNLTNALELPLVIASQIQTALTIPIFPQLTNLFAAYGSFLGDVETTPNTYTSNTKIELEANALYGAGAMAALATKVATLDYESRSEAISAFEKLLEEYDKFRTYFDAQEAATASLPLADRFSLDSEVYDSLDRLIKRVSGDVGALLSGLKQEVILTAEFDTTPLNIVAEHYPATFFQDSDEALDFFERTNNLSGDELFLIEQGSEYKVFI